MANGSQKKHIGQVLKTLYRVFPNPGAMELGDPYRTLVGVILSARTRDEQVLKLARDFFRAFPSVRSLARADVQAVTGRLKTIGMFRQKAQRLVQMAQAIVQRFHGQVPHTMGELVSLPGVGRKSASVLLVACFQQPAIAVDTHVHRVTNRLGWVQTKTPEQSERALLKLVPLKLQPLINRVFVKFGRYICIPGRPRCWMCPVRDHCSFSSKQLTVPKNAAAVRADIFRREEDLEKKRKYVAASP